MTSGQSSNRSDLEPLLREMHGHAIAVQLQHLQEQSGNDALVAHGKARAFWTVLRILTDGAPESVTHIPDEYRALSDAARTANKQSSSSDTDGSGAGGMFR